MKRILAAMLSACLIVSCLSGCNNMTIVKRDLTGTWADDDGYTIQFREDGTFLEDVYGTPMAYEFSNGNLTYVWPDGYTRRTNVSFEWAGPTSSDITMKFNGKTRTFKASNKTVAAHDWTLTKLDKADPVLAKYNLISKVGLYSEIYLTAGSQFSLTCSAGANPVESWREADGRALLGLYADAGPGDNLYLYSTGGTMCEVLRQSASGKYAGFYPLSTTVKSSSVSYANGAEGRGYNLVCSATDTGTDIRYQFNADNTAMKWTTDGMTINYRYFLDSDGLVTLTCSDGLSDTDYMWFDINTNVMYRLVYERSSWVDFMQGVSNSVEAATATTMSYSPVAPYAIPSQLSSGKNSTGLLDPELIIHIDGDDSLHLLCTPTFFSSDLYLIMVTAEMRAAQEMYLGVQSLNKGLYEQDLLKLQKELTAEQSKQAFLDQMAELVRLNEERAAEEQRQKEYEAWLRSQGTTNYNYSGYYSASQGETGTYTPANEDYTIGSGFTYPATADGNAGWGSTSPTTTDTAGSTNDAITSSGELSNTLITPGIDINKILEDLGQEAQSKYGNTSDDLASSATNSHEGSSVTAGTSIIPVEPSQNSPGDTPTSSGSSNSGVDLVVEFYCNCDECHQDSYPCAPGESGVAYVNTRYWGEGERVNVSCPFMVSAVTRNGAGITSGNVMQVYSTNHTAMTTLVSGIEYYTYQSNS